MKTKKETQANLPKSTKKVVSEGDDRPNRPVMEKNRAKRKANFLNAYYQNRCNVSETCRQIGIDRKTYYSWIEEDPDFLGKAEEVEESMIDWVESRLQKLMGGTGMPAVSAVTFYLKTKGKKRGYVQTHVFTGPNNSPLVPQGQAGVDENKIADTLLRMTPEQRKARLEQLTAKNDNPKDKP